MLAGELLIVKALSVSGEIIESKCPPEKLSDIVKAFEGFFIDVWEGEYMEILCRKNLDTELEDYHTVLWKSTADTEACTRLGAIMGNGSLGQIETLAEFGRRLGYMYRLRDDLKDSMNVELNLPCRLENESVPLPVLYAAKTEEKARRKVERVLRKERITPQDAKEISRLCLKSGALSYVTKLAKQNAMEALSKLRSLTPGFARNMLELDG